MVLVDSNIRPLTPGFLYNSGNFDAEAELVAAAAPIESIVQGSGSALSRLLRLQKLARPGPKMLCHQADFALARLTGRAGVSDESNALKTGYDAQARCWPSWMTATGLDTSLLPNVVPVGTPVSTISNAVAKQYGLSKDVRLIAGATDSVAAFLAAGARDVGAAVTSLGTTLALKILSDTPVEDVSRGIYSHRIGDLWLPGGASNTGGGVLLEHFTTERLVELSGRIDPTWISKLDLYPLTRPGERFPHNDPGFPPRMAPRPADDGEYLFELMSAMARIEREGYRALKVLGAPYPATVMTAGGGAANTVWMTIRAAVLGVPVIALPHSDAAFGMARLARNTFTGGAENLPCGRSRMSGLAAF